MTKKEFVNYILDLLSPYGCIKERAMFGGYGIYKEGIIVAIIIADELYFKVDDQSVKVYEAKGSKPFTYKANSKTITLSYRQVPLDVMEDEELLGEWLIKAWQISLNRKNHKKHGKI